jgi:hypothetical protein
MKRHVVERKTADVALPRSMDVVPERRAGLFVDLIAVLRS